MSSSKVVQKLVLLVAVACFALGAFKGAEATVQCNEVQKNLMPCVSYLLNGGKIADDCCKGVKTLFGEAKTGSDRRDVCTCIKKAVNGVSVPRKSLALAAGLPDKCGVSIPYKISPSTNCESVK